MAVMGCLTAGVFSPAKEPKKCGTKRKRMCVVAAIAAKSSRPSSSSLVKGGGQLCVRSCLSRVPVGRGFRSLQITDPFRNKRFPVKFSIADGLLHDHTIGG